MRLSRPLAVLTAMAVGSVGLLVVGLGSFLDVSRAESPAHPHLVAVAPAAPGTAITGRLVDPDGRPADNVEVQALPVGGGAPVASAISYGGRFELLVPTGTWRVVGTDLTHPARFAPLTAGTVEVGAGVVRRLGELALSWRAPEVLRVPQVAGVAKVGRTLTVDTGTWDHRDLSFEVVWLRGSAVVGRGRKYRVGWADAGAALRARVTASAPATAASRVATAPVRVRTVRLAATGSHAGRKVVVKVRAKGAQRLDVEVRRGSRVVATASAAPRAVVRVAGPAKRLAVGPVGGRRADRVPVVLH